METSEAVQRLAIFCCGFFAEAYNNLQQGSGLEFLRVRAQRLVWVQGGKYARVQGRLDFGIQVVRFRTSSAPTSVHG